MLTLNKAQKEVPICKQCGSKPENPILGVEDINKPYPDGLAIYCYKCHLLRFGEMPIYKTK